MRFRLLGALHTRFFVFFIVKLWSSSTDESSMNETYTRKVSMSRPKTKPSTDRRIAPRKEISPINVSYITSLSDFTRIAKNCEIVEASSSGLLLLIKRADLLPPSLRKNLSLDVLIGENIFMHLEDMNLEISGTIARTQLLGKKGFHLAIDYSEDAPEYWRECLMDLLPIPGEME